MTITRSLCCLLISVLTSALFACGPKATEPAQQGSTLQSIQNRKPAAFRQGFVYAEGSRFLLDGKPFYFTGTNLYNLGLLDGFSEAVVEDTLAKVAKKNLSVVRIWGFANGKWEKSGTSPIQTAPDTFDEVALIRLDYVIARAEAHQVKLIITLSNFEADYGGFQWYVDQFVGKGKDKELFYSEPAIKASFKRYLSFLMTRRNTFTGRLYSDEPAVMAWELANEPHTSDGYETALHLKPGKLVNDWLSEMSAYLKQLDPNHLIASGEEGYQAGVRKGNHDWLDNGWKGVDFKANLSLPFIDFGTLHCYPTNWGFSYNERGWILDHFIGNRQKIAGSMNGGQGKPLILEEFGCRKAYGNRDQLLGEVFQYANQVGLAGTMVWRVTPVDTDDTYDYDFDFSGEGATAVFEQAALTVKKNHLDWDF